MQRGKLFEHVDAALAKLLSCKPDNVNEKLGERTVADVLKDAVVREQFFKDLGQRVKCDLSAFLEYVGEPAALQRRDVGWKVILFLALFTFVAWLLKVEYWRDVH